MSMDTGLVQRIGADLGVELSLSHGMPVANVAPAQVLAAATTLRDQHGFDMLLDVTAVDWLGQAPDVERFQVVWHFFCTARQQRLRLKTRVPQADPAVASLVGLYGSAAFMERECHDMLGIRFVGNADLRPILLYEGFIGHPLRKDYAKQHEQPLVPYREGASRA
jgi:NADH-quinone oxidoreductase subunit C